MKQLIQDFILEYESGGLSGYLYNRIPDFGRIQATIVSMSRHGLVVEAAVKACKARAWREATDTPANGAPPEAGKVIGIKRITPDRQINLAGSYENARGGPTPGRTLDDGHEQ